jgi:transcriptional regulator with XRE-family HTH domain
MTTPISHAVRRQQYAHALRSFREANGLTQQELVDRLTALVNAQGGPLVGLDRQMVSKWERGTKAPSPYYRKLLERLFTTPLRVLVPVSMPTPDAIVASRQSLYCRNSRFSRMFGAQAVVR